MNLTKVLLLTALTCASLSFAQAPPSFSPPSSNPENLTAFGDHIYFCAEDGLHGRELWRVDLDGNAELIRDLTPGPDGSELDAFYGFQGVLYFKYAPIGGGGQLWRTDGTEEGTTRVHRLGESGGGLLDIVGHSEQHMYLITGDSATSKTLWKSDGTPEGTSPMLYAGSSSECLFASFHGAVSGGELYLGARLVDTREALVRTDSESGQIKVIKMFGVPPNSFFALDSGAVLFGAQDKSHGQELWITKGDEASTRLLRDIYPGPEGSGVGEFHYFRPPSGDKVLFAATTEREGRELWVTNGTPEGTRLWHDIVPGAGSSNPYKLTSNSNALCFVALGETVGKEVWHYDASRDELYPVSDINPGLASSDPYELCLNSNDRIFFSAVDGNKDEELWAASFTGEEAKKLYEINPGPKSSFPYYTIEHQGHVVTVATGPVVGRELWVAPPNGIPELLADIHTDTSVNPSSTPSQLTLAGDLLYFVANDIAHGLELWRSDGTQAGTEIVRDIFPGRPGSDPSELTAVGKLLYFVAENGMHGYELWRSDGTEAGTAMLTEINPSGSARPSGLTPFNKGLIFSAYRPLDGEELWFVEPGQEPHLLSDINPGAASGSPQGFVAWNGHVYFRATDGLHGNEFWRSDGTTDGTIMVKDVVNAPVESISYLAPGVTEDSLYLAAELDHRGAELWRMDSSGNEIRLVRDIAVGEYFDVLRRVARPR
jgi:ELWxxDGT repeat protein